MVDLTRYNLQDVKASQPRQSWHKFRGSTSDHDRALSALQAIPPDLSHDDWVKVGMALQAAGGTFDDFDQWSAGADSYNAQVCRETWKSIKPGKGINAATLFGMARKYGWTEGTQQPAPARATRPVAPLRKPTPGMGASEVWERSAPATPDHPYIVAKCADGVPLNDLRVVPMSDSLRINGQSMAGALMVPAYSTDGELQSAQFIPAPGAGKKMNLPGAMSGATFIVGKIEPAGVIYIVEGIGQAWACWQGTGEPSVVTFGAGNMSKTAETLSQQYPFAQLVLVPDVGQEAKAAEIAVTVGAAVAYMPEGWDKNSDVNDLMQRDGLDALKSLLEAASVPLKTPPLLKPVSVGDVFTNPSPSPEYIWDGYLPRGVVSMLGAHGGTGKSTIALMLGVCNALGRPLFGVDTVQCKTLFVSLEDSASIVRHRLAHICTTWTIDPALLNDRLNIVDGTEYPELFAAENRGAGDTTATYFELRKLVQQGNIGLVVVDNASDAFGADEIQRRQVRAFIRALAEVAGLTNCAVLLLAHVDKATSKARKAEGGEGYSGSTAWHNGVRSRLFMTRAEDGAITLEHQKSNLGKKREPITLEWLDGGLPMIAGDAPTISGFASRIAGRADDDRAVALLKLIAEYEGRQAYCSPATTSRSHVYAVLKSDPMFQRLKLGQDAVKRIVTQCQRAKWIEMLDYRSADRKPHQRWTLTTEGRAFAGLPAPTAPSAPTTEVGASQNKAQASAPTAPTGVGGVGERARTPVGAKRRRKGKAAKP